MDSRKESLKQMITLASRLTEIVNEMKARAHALYPDKHRLQN